MLQLFDDFFDAGDGNVHARHRGAQAPVAFVLDQAQRSGFCHRKVDTGEADVGPGKFVAQDLAPDLN